MKKKLICILLLMFVPLNILAFVQGDVNGDTLVWTAGMAQWAKLSQVPELAKLLATQVPPPIPTL